MIRRIAITLLLLSGAAFWSLGGFAQDTDEAADAQTAPIEAAGEAPTTEDEPQFDIQLGGQKTWTVRTGFGSPLALATSGLTPGSVALDQSLTVEITGEALDIFRIEAQYDDQLPDVMQSLALYVDTDRLHGVLGDFTFDAVPDFTSYMKSMRGLEVEYHLGDAVLTAVASRTEGIPETAVFIGNTTHADVDYTRWQDEAFDDPTPYRRSLDGLFAYTLQQIYSEEFSSMSFGFAADAGLRSVFAAYEVDYLYDAAAEDPQLEIKSQDIYILDADEQILLLRRDPLCMLRDQLEELIDVYNEAQGLSGSDAKEYPFIEGTDHELAFLNAVLPYARIVIDEIVYPVSAGERRRFFLLGHGDVHADTSTVEVSKNGRFFDSVDDFTLSEYDVAFYEEPGILECRFPDDFFTDTSVIRVSFDYEAVEGAFMLGLSLIPGSERVMLNSQVLEPDTDYEMSYELGMLILKREIGETDVLQVDYERYAGGLGTTSAYASNFYGLTLDWPALEMLDLRVNVLQLADVATSVSNPDAVATMPNRHTIAGIQADVTLGDLRADVLIGYNVDVFPFDDNSRDAAVNQINAVESGDGYVLFGHQSGLTVREDGVWQTYGVSSGLASYRVQAVDMADGIVYVGTDQGLTAIALDGSWPFDLAANWSQLIRVDDLPSASITALHAGDGGIWVGTDAGLAWLPTGEGAESNGASMIRDGGADALSAVTDLVQDGDRLYIGTDAGVYLLDVDSGSVQIVPGTDTSAVNALWFTNDTLYVASDRGLRGFRDGRSMGWLVLGEPVLAVAVFEGHVVYGTASGLVSLDGEPALLYEGRVTAIAIGPNGFWVGAQSVERLEATVLWGTDEITEMRETVTGIPSRNPYAFVDSPASEHTVSGWMSRASFRQRTDAYTISGTIEYQPATFRAIGTSSRSDRTGWTLAGDIPLSDLGDLSLSHDYRLSGLDGGARSHWMSNDMHLSWATDDGPRWSASLGYVEETFGDVASTPPERELSGSISVRQSFFRDALDLTMRWNRYVELSDEPSDCWERGALSLTFGWDITSDLSTSGTWSRPIRRSGTEQVGSEHAHWDVTWKPEITFGDARFAGVDLEYAIDTNRDVSESEWDWTHEGEVLFDFRSFDLLEWAVTPDLKVWGDISAAKANLHVKADSRLEQGDWTVRTTLWEHWTDLRRPIYYRQGQWEVDLKFAGLDALDPSLN